MNEVHIEPNNHSEELVGIREGTVSEDGSNTALAGYAAETSVVPKVSSYRFDYSEFDEAFAAHAEEIAERIRNRMRASIIECGRDLIAVKDRLKHGKFGDWLKCHFSFSERTAQNMMNAALVFGSAPKIVDMLPDKLIYTLSSKSTPDELKQTLAQEVLAGNVLEPGAIQQRLKDATVLYRDHRNSERVEREVASARRVYERSLKKERQTDEECARALAKWDAEKAPRLRQLANASKSAPLAAPHKKANSAAEEKVEINRQYTDEEIINDAKLIYQDLKKRYDTKLSKLLQGMINIYNKNRPKKVPVS